MSFYPSCISFDLDWLIIEELGDCTGTGVASVDDAERSSAAKTDAGMKWFYTDVGTSTAKIVGSIEVF